jgi:hypothetical protein
MMQQKCNVDLFEEVRQQDIKIQKNLVPSHHVVASIVLMSEDRSLHSGVETLPGSE